MPRSSRSIPASASARSGSKIIQWEDNLFRRASSTRCASARSFRFGGACYDANRRRVISAIACKDDELRSNGELTFKILLIRARTTILIVNDDDRHRSAKNEQGGPATIWRPAASTATSSLRAHRLQSACVGLTQPDGDHRRPLQGECAPRARRRAASARAEPRPPQLHRQARARPSRRCRSSSSCAHEARAIKDHTLDHLDLYLEAYEARVTAPGGHVHFAETAEDARRIDPRHLPQRRREDRHQGQVDDLRGDRAQRPPRGERHRADRDRSRRIHHPASRRGRRATSSRRPCT